MVHRLDERLHFISTGRTKRLWNVLDGGGVCAQNSPNLCRQFWRHHGVIEARKLFFDDRSRWRWPIAALPFTYGATLCRLKRFARSADGQVVLAQERGRQHFVVHEVARVDVLDQRSERSPTQ